MPELWCDSWNQVVRGRRVTFYRVPYYRDKTKTVSYRLFKDRRDAEDFERELKPYEKVGR